uniref:Uncharacterized protein n=1 Tax=Romanomermis culicivorax TaxID=13658 RepID=A0A915J5H6_ROMCU
MEGLLILSNKFFLHDTEFLMITLFDRFKTFEIDLLISIDRKVYPKWDDKLAEVSQRWIESCYEKGHSEDSFRERISGYKPVGENMAYSWSTEMEKTVQNSTEVARIVAEFIKCRTYREALYMIEGWVGWGYDLHTNDTYFMITNSAMFKTSPNF